MLKATRRSAVLLATVAVGMLIASMPSFAEVQNVKVGGDITARAFHRECLDLNCGDDLDETNTLGVLTEGEDDFLMSTVGVNVGADLTENVGAFIRLTSERDWNADATGGATGDFDISQAYVTLKELFYSPLTLRIGQQPIVWGRGLVLGSNLLPGVILGGGDRNGSITANEFTDFTSFDALRATLDLSGVSGIGVPLTADLVYIKVDENVTAASDDRTVMGVNLGARMDDMNAELETYYLNLRGKDTVNVANAVDAAPGNRDGSVSTIGVRGSARPAEGANVYAEAAYQFGKRLADIEAILPAGDSAQAWLFNLGADMTFADVAMTPKLGAEWRYTSGKDVDAAVGGWTPIAPGYFTTALREFQTRSTTAAGFYNNSQVGVTSGQTNQHELGFYGSVKPMEDLTLNQRLSWFWLPVGAVPPTNVSATASGAKRERFLGAEWDTVATYNYTDDVQFGVIYGVFFPGAVFRSPALGTANGNDTAQELITTVSVKF